MQQSLLDFRSPSEIWDQDASRRALDELFTLARHYRSSKDYFELLRFIGKFRNYAPFNAMLVHMQKPGATYVAPAHRWAQDYRHRVKPGAHPLVILQPMGPVMFVFDVSDTEPEDGALPIPKQVLNPFEVIHGHVGDNLPQTIDNARRDGVRVTTRDAGSTYAGSIQSVKPGLHLDVLAKVKPERQYVRVPLRYELLLNSDHSPETQYTTLIHELAHLYCGHLGTPNPRWWPDRRGNNLFTQEFEAESVCFLLCRRLGIEGPSAEYLAGYVKNCPEVPPISFDCVMKATGLIEQMGRERLSPRKAEDR